MAGACRRLLLVSPLLAGFWSSISWLCNFFLWDGGGEEGVYMSFSTYVCTSMFRSALTPFVTMLIMWACHFAMYPPHFFFLKQNSLPVSTRTPLNSCPPRVYIYGSALPPVQSSSRGEPSHLVPSVGAVGALSSSNYPMELFFCLFSTILTNLICIC